MIWTTEAEITACYLNGTDVLDLIARRQRRTALLLSPLAFFGLYFIKSALGINLFADLHLSDILTLGLI